MTTPPPPAPATEEAAGAALEARELESAKNSPGLLAQHLAVTKASKGVWGGVYVCVIGRGLLIWGGDGMGVMLFGL